MPRRKTADQLEDLAKTIGKSDKGSGPKAKVAAERNQFDEGDMMETPMNADGKPLAKISIAAAELIPTGQYANVSIGPVQITAYVDLDRDLPDDEYFTEAERHVLTSAANELAFLIERDVVSVHRNLVLKGIQDAIEG